MASRPKQKFNTLHEQDALLEAFYNELNEGEESFLGNRFIYEYDIDDDYKLEIESDNNKAENEANATGVEQEIEQIEEEVIDKENIVREKHQTNPKILQQFNGNKSSKLLMMF